MDEAAGQRSRTRSVVVGVIAAAALIPRALTTGHFQTADEPLWMARSWKFSEALRHLRFADASATTDGLATMPGVTTMWLGTAARAVWAVGRRVGLVDGTAQFTASPAAIRLGQLTVALTTAALIALIVRLTWTWLGPVAATTAGTLLATEPFFVAHGAVLHTDELTTLFGVAGAIALLRALGIADQLAGRRRDLMAAGAGALLALAALTKVSALALAPGLLVPIGWTVAQAIRARSAGDAAPLRAAARTGLIVGATGVAVVLVLWPAIWADPVHQFSLLRDSAELASTPHRQFFLGEITRTPGPAFYLVALPARLTPWALLALAAGAPLAWRRSTRLVAVMLAAPALGQLVVISFAAKQFDRYGLSVLAFLSVLMGLGMQHVAERLPRRIPPRRAVVGLATACLLVTGYAVHVSPHGLAYYNPLLGGSSFAERNLLVGWGEGLEAAGAVIEAREGPSCDVRIAVAYPGLTANLPCGHLVSSTAAADYRVLYVGERQRAAPEAVARVRATGQLVATVTIRGILYAEVYDLRLTAESDRAG